VGMAGGHDFGAAQLREKPDEADRGSQEHDRQPPDKSRPQPAVRNGERDLWHFIVGWQVHADLAILPCSSLEAFRTKWSPANAICGKLRQSMSSSVANSVRRDAQAVIAAISTACA